MKKIAFFLFLLAFPAHAQAPKGLDGKKPIEINADSLEVLQEQNLAVFRGKVLAVQGETRLKSDVMTVYYKKKEGGQAPNDPTQSTVERIEVEGEVVLATPEETASGDRGVYDVSRKQVRLLSNVVLTRGKNVLKGDSLVYDFATGKSVLNSPQHTPAGVGSGGRVRALFVPEKEKSE
jgi:lipopolysaccharide export system protein LptA